MEKKNRLTEYIVYQYFLLLSLITINKLLFIYVNIPLKDRGDFIDYIGSFRYGLIFDSALSSYIILGSLIFYMVYKVLSIIRLEIIGRYLNYIYCFTMGFVFFTIMILDIWYYNTFTHHADITVFGYTGHMGEIWTTFWVEYPVIRIILWLILTVITYTTCSIINFSKVMDRNPKFNILEIIKSSMIIIVAVPIFVISARGGITGATLTWGRAEFSQNYFANQTALNGVFALFQSVDVNRNMKSSDANSIKNKFTPEELKSNIRNYVTQPQDTYLPGKNILRRTTDTGRPVIKPNVVLILMESFMGSNVGALGYEPDLTPNYNRLAKEGIIFKNVYSTGKRSNRGVVSAITGYPSSYGQALIKKSIAGRRTFYSIPDILKNRGYTTHFYYGGDIEFDNMKAFLVRNGIDTIFDMDDFPKKDRTIAWGVPDDKMFARMTKDMGEIKEPFFAEAFTLSNHSPYDVPKEFQTHSKKEYPRMYNKYNGTAFADYTIGKFTDSVKDKKWAQNTIFVFVADHGANRSIPIEIDWKKFTNPLLIWSPNKNLVKPQAIDTLGSQIDLLPTLMHILGGKYEHATWGKNLFLKDNEEEFAYVVDTQYIGVIDKNYIYIEDIIGKKDKLVRKEDNKKVENIDLANYREKARTFLELSIEQEKEGTFGKEN
ncbi:MULTISPECIES: LTA synthase family protein [Psychrilyobacter]|uniref:Alkaline phosphatase family protein n=1 Tax=Psychrilyobacter piezotolerans TaxID=2293438 RepID=A0ABX9KF49_9FUSO|nr:MULTISPECIES: alkaline phosphatase family protein [Psychrilyobacter]MCS5420838.1 sulfatase-like hydrolase/transferase [Psychrilyobacter sp. S5]NDI79118.1 sulfatase-like hydrolase/transferase [Psychrilyobacter piezotolerans]RDE59761.1 alkaline phosphatase family protein [Psychrilyobacter sp. S5]REI40087.1 alkaline phosphatase family protein [Psychrilyobacter piezotolerans]